MIIAPIVLIQMEVNMVYKPSSERIREQLKRNVDLFLNGNLSQAEKNKIYLNIHNEKKALDERINNGK